jgi:5'-3' exoribonuclease 1
MQIFTYSPESLGAYEAPAYFPTVVKNHAVVTGVLREDWDVPHEKLRKGLMAGVKLDVFFPGFPTLKHLSHAAAIKKAEVRVFEQASRGESMILTLSRDLSVLKTSLAEEAKAWLGKEVWISWPHMTEARVVELRDDKVSYSLRQDQTVMEEALEDGKTEFALHVKSIATRQVDRDSACATRRL